MKLDIVMNFFEKREYVINGDKYYLANSDCGYPLISVNGGKETVWEEAFIIYEAEDETFEIAVEVEYSSIIEVDGVIIDINNLPTNGNFKFNTCTISLDGVLLEERLVIEKNEGFVVKNTANPNGGVTTNIYNGNVAIAVSRYDTLYGSCQRPLTEEQIVELKEIIEYSQFNEFFKREAQEQSCCGTYPVFSFWYLKRKFMRVGTRHGLNVYYNKNKKEIEIETSDEKSVFYKVLASSHNKKNLIVLVDGVKEHWFLD